MKTKVKCILLALLASAITSHSYALDLEAGPRMNGALSIQAMDSEDYSFTGQPFNSDTHEYLFAFRSYDSMGSRWTTTDPSGFPDGANNNVYAPVPTFQFDTTGLAAGDLVPGVFIKRKNIDLFGSDKYGHWWIEIDGESYGWWPKNPVGPLDTIFGVPGELNGQTSFGGTATLDPHDGDPADKSWQAKHTDGKTDAEVKGLIRSFATGYSGDWSWPFGQNCHSFQKSLMKASFIE